MARTLLGLAVTMPAGGAYLDGARALLGTAKAETAVKLALDLLDAARALPDPAPLLRAAVALLGGQSAAPVLRVVEGDEGRKKAAGA